MTDDFWTGGSRGELLIARCQDCLRYLHPPPPVCAQCGGRSIGAEVVSGRATLWSWTMNRYAFSPSMEPPYLVALVELEEQSGLRLVTNIVGCSPDDLSIGMALHVEFEPADDVFVPVFAP